MARSARIATAAMALIAGMATVTVHAQSVTRTNLVQAQAIFDGMPVRDRNEALLELMATGDFTAMASDQFDGRLYDAVASFQAKHGVEQSGVLTEETLAALSTVGGRIFNSWGFEFLDHPAAPASLAVPGRFAFVRSPTQHGFALNTRNRSISVNFAFFPDNEATLGSIFDNLTRPAPGRRIDMKVIKPTFFAVAGGSDFTGNYSRYIVVPGGIAGFTVTWNTKAVPNGDRLAVVMANELYPRHMLSNTGQQTDIFKSLPGAASPQSADSPSNGLFFSEETPTNAGTDVVSQAALQAKVEAKQKEADRQAAVLAAARAAAEEKIKVAQQQEADRKARVEADRLIRQAEADQKKKDEKEARERAAAKLKADRLARATEAAQRAIEDASGFVKADRQDPQLESHLDRISDLNAALANAEPDTVESKTNALMAALTADPAYSAYKAQRAVEEQRKNARYLGDAVRTLKTQRGFLIGAVAQDPTSSRAARFLSLAKQAEAVLAAPDLERAQTLMGTIDEAINEAGLRDTYAAASAAAEKAATAEADAARVAASQPVPAIPQDGMVTAGATAPQVTLGEPGHLPVTDKNRFLFDGGREDVVFMVNMSAKAPHAYRDLKGDLVFDRDQADVCFVGQDADSSLAKIVRSALSAYRLKQLAISPAACDGVRLNSYDVVATRRGVFLRQEPQAALQLVEAIETDTLKLLTTITPAALQAATAAESVAGEAVAEDIEQGTRAGFGLLLINRGVSVSAVCAVTPENAEAHRRLLTERNDALAASMGAEPVIAPTTADGAFVSAKRGSCGAVYASAADLKVLANGLKRDGTNYRFSSIWITPEEVKSANKDVDAAKKAAEKQAEDRRIEHVEQEKLEQNKAAKEAATLSARQEASRKQYGASAMAAAARIAADVDSFTESRGGDAQIAAQKFAAFSEQFRGYLGDEWEKMSENSEVADYGTADWKGRTLDAAFTRVTIRLKNRILGDYRDLCFVFGQIDDPEFNTTREHIGVPCDDNADLASWKTGHGFKSRWNLSTTDDVRSDASLPISAVPNAGIGTRDSTPSQYADPAREGQF